MLAALAESSFCKQWAAFVIWTNMGLLVFSLQKLCRHIVAAGLPLQSVLTMCELGLVTQVSVVEIIHLQYLLFIVMTGPCVYHIGLSLELTLLKMTTGWNKMTERVSQSGESRWRQGREGERSRPTEQKERCVKHTCTHRAVQSDSMVLTVDYSGVRVQQ